MSCVSTLSSVMKQLITVNTGITTLRSILVKIC